MRYITLTKGRRATVDDRFYDALVAMGSWHYLKNGYAQHSFRKDGKRHAVLMHRAVMKLDGVDIDGFQVDHRNRRKCDNQRRNLRRASSQQNRRNTKTPANNKSGYKGVYFDRPRGLYTTQIMVNGWRRRVGRFPTLIEAAIAYDAAATKHFGEFAKLNFPRNKAA